MQDQIRIPRCLGLLLAIEQETDCKKTECWEHLLCDSLELDPERIHKTEKYFDCCGCGKMVDEPWQLPEIAELWGWDKELVFYYEKKAMARLRRLEKEFGQ